MKHKERSKKKYMARKQKKKVSFFEDESIANTLREHSIFKFIKRHGFSTTVSLLIFVVLFSFVSTSKATNDTQKCYSDNQCIYLSNEYADEGILDFPSPYCWLDHKCRGEKQFVVTLNRQNETAQIEPYPTFVNKETMCVTIMINPFIVLFDNLWEAKLARENDSTLVETKNEFDIISSQQNRIEMFDLIPFMIQIERISICSSDKNQNNEFLHKPSNSVARVGDFDKNAVNSIVKQSKYEYIPHSFIKHYNPSNAASGCSSEHSSIRKKMIYHHQQEKTNKKNKVTFYPSSSGMSKKVCFEVEPIGPPEVPCLVEIQAILALKEKKPNQDLSPYINLINSYGLNINNGVLPHNESKLKNQKITKTNVQECKKKKHISTRHKHKHDVNGISQKECTTKEINVTTYEFKQVSYVNVTITSADALNNHPKTSLELDSSISKRKKNKKNKKKTVVQKGIGYYYYYDPLADGYYYYHPHVHCGFDYEFNNVSKSCRYTFYAHNKLVHEEIIVLAVIGIIVGIIFFVIDYKSKALYN